VQGEFEKALRKLGWERQSITLAGRTDTGTHASGQVAAFDLDWRHETDDLQRALNANLPDDMSVREVKIAADEFHPRFDARWRQYRYRLFCARLGTLEELCLAESGRRWGLSPLAGIWKGPRF
jgi:tRNA pseudouridine38-40 synthase